MRYAGREASLTVAGVVTSGGSEDSQLFVSAPVAQDLAGLGGRIGLAQLSVRGTPPEIEDVMRRLAAALPELEVRPVRQLAAAEGRLLERIHGLLFVTIALILVLSALGVLAAMAGLAMERRRDVGLMKALGGSVRRVMRFFLAEATAIGAVAVSSAVAWACCWREWIGQRVFDAPIAPRLVVVPITVAADDCRGARRSLAPAFAWPRAARRKFCEANDGAPGAGRERHKAITADCARSTA